MKVLFVLIIFSTLLVNINCIYTHAAFVNDIRQSRRKGRDLKKFDPSEEYSIQMNQTALLGLPKCSYGQCQRIAIVGAGVAGLTIGYELRLAGHDVQIFESSERPGGRLFTYNTGNTIIELGGMRFPLDIHTLTDIYLRKRFHLPLEPFVSFDPNTFVYINGIKRRSDNTTYLPSDFHLSVPSNEFNRCPFDRWNEAIKPLRQLFEKSGWKSVVDKYGSYNVKQYLLEFGLSDLMIDYIGLVFGIETNLFTALTSHFRDALLINERTKFFHILGGNERLIAQLAQKLSINYSTSVLSINQNANQTVDITYQNLQNQSQTTNFDRVVVATTAPAARLIHYHPIDNQMKDLSRALRQLHYDCSSKIVLYFNQSWWNDLNIFGGSTTTDLPLRFIYYDNYNTTLGKQNASEFVLLASYSFAQDSTLWSSSTVEQITNEALNNLEEIHGRTDLRKFYLRTIVKHWCDDQHSHGAYALYLPYQEEDLRPILTKSLNNQIFFSGEHLSTAHAWVEGSVLSALSVLIQLQNEKFDFVIIGGGLLALQTAIQLIDRQSDLNILLIERNSFSNPFCSNQFEPISTNQTSTDYLQFGRNSSFNQFNSTDLMQRFHFNNLSNDYQGQLDGKLQFINTTDQIIQLLDLIKQEKKYHRINLAENEQFLHFDQNQIITDRRTLILQKKILFLDNCYLSDYLQQSIKLNIQFKQYPLLTFSPKGNLSIPTWLYQNHFLCFNINQTNFIRFFNSDIPRGLSWLRNHASALIHLDPIENSSIYKQTVLVDQDYLIDFVPNSNNRSIVLISQTNLDRNSYWTKILTDLSFDNGSEINSNYSIPKLNQTTINSSSFHCQSTIVVFLFCLFCLIF